ncbi:MAG TPA: iron-containing alcohol dehydrogenase, partial [Lacisediminihabitans sp.]
LGLVHGMAHPLGAFYNAPHGVANGILLAPVMAFNADYTGERFRDIAVAFAVPGAAEMTLGDVRTAAVDVVAALTRDLGNPTTLREIGAKEEDLPALARAAFEDVCTGGNPREATVEQIQDLYASIY